MKVDLPIQLPQKYVKWLLIASSLVFVCGILAIVLPLTFSLGIAVFLGLVVLVAGMAHAVFAFQTQHIGGFLGHMLLFALYEMAAICLFANSLLSILLLAVMLAGFFLLEGVFGLLFFFCLLRFRPPFLVFIYCVG